MYKTYHFNKLRLRLYLKTIIILIILIDISYFIVYRDQDIYIKKLSAVQQIPQQQEQQDKSIPYYADYIKTQVLQYDTSPDEHRLRSLFTAKSYDQASRIVRSKVNNLKNFRQFDRRLLPAFWLNMINDNLDNVTGQIPSNFSLPFNWDLLNDIAARLPLEPYFNKVVKERCNCEEFRDIAPKNVPGSYLKEFCENYDYSKPNFINDYKLPIKVVRKIDQYLTDVDWRRIHGMMHTLIQLEIPSNVLFMGGVKGKSLMIPLQQVSNGENDLTKYKKTTKLKSYYDTMTENYVSSELAKLNGDAKITRDDILLKGISVYKELVKLNSEISIPKNHEVAPVYKPSKPTIVGHGISSVPPPSTLEINQLDFQWYLPDEIKKLKKEIKSATPSQNTTHHKHLLDWSEFIVNPDNRQPWYYGIPSIENKMLDHYDWRFFHDITYEDDQELHVNVLHRLARTWFKLCQEFEIPTWLNHGSLIGWYWNGASMPYDGDLDLQMPIQSLHKLSKFLNNTLIYDFSDRTGYVNNDWELDMRAELGVRSYLFDVDPMYFDRNGINNGDNNIDARIIDTETGLYIDLTALAEFHSESQYDLAIQKKYLEITSWTHPRVTIPPFIENFFDDKDVFHKNETKSQEIIDSLKNQIKSELDSGRKNSVGSKSPTRELYRDFVHCKHFHTYDLKELGPLIPTYFENTLSYLPSNWYRNLLIDYGSTDPITNAYYNHNKFWLGAKQWINYNDCPDMWDYHSGKALDGDSEQDVILKCMNSNDLVDKQVKMGFYYGLQHDNFKKQLKIGKLGVVDYDYEEKLLPILEKLKTDHPLKSEVFVNRYLY